MYWDLYWLPDEAQQDLLLRLTPSAFGENRAAWGIALTQTYALKGDREKVRQYAAETRRACVEQLKGSPEDAYTHVLYGFALAYLGRKEEAIREGSRGVVLLPVSKDAYSGPYMQLHLVRIHLLLGENERALDALEPLLEIPFYLSPGWLQVDPTFRPLKGNPRFEKLIRAKQ